MRTSYVVVAQNRTTAAEKTCVGPNIDAPEICRILEFAIIFFIYFDIAETHAGEGGGGL